MKTINSSRDVAEYLGVPGAAWNTVQRLVYKNTSCGAWIDFEYAAEENGGSYLLVGSIVEGSDVDCQTQRLRLPTTSKNLELALQAVEEEAEEIWLEWNGEEYQP